MNINKLYHSKNAYAIKKYFVQNLIWKGKKITAEYYLHQLLYNFKINKKFHSFDVLYFSLLDLRPLISLKSVKLGSVIFKVPAPISEHRRQLFSIKSILISAKDSRGKIKINKLTDLMLSLFTGTKNLANSKKINLYREAIDNSMFVRYLK